MVKKFNEFGNKHKLNEELLDDYFLPIKDMGLNYTVGFAVSGSGELDQFINLDERCRHPYEIEPVSRVGYLFRISLYHDSHDSDDTINIINNIKDLNFYNRYLSELTSICNRINNHYDVTVHITDFNNDIVQVIFEYNPTIKEARFISWEYLKNYESEITPHLTSDLRKIGPKETNKGDDYLVIFELEEDSIEVSEDGFKKYLSQAIENFRGKFKYESFTKEGSKYILKNFISINDILFKY